jgi:hypothetical protein
LTIDAADREHMCLRQVRCALPRARSYLRARENANAVTFAQGKPKSKKNMKTKYLSVIGLVGVALLAFACKSGGDQTSTTTRAKKISAADKAAIKEIFRGANAKNYRIWFDGGKDTMGSKKLTLASIKQGGRTGVGTGAFLVDDDIGICYKGTVPLSVFEAQLGKEKMQRLNTIMARYQ